MIGFTYMESGHEGYAYLFKPEELHLLPENTYVLKTERLIDFVVEKEAEIFFRDCPEGVFPIDGLRIAVLLKSDTMDSAIYAIRRYGDLDMCAKMGWDV